MSAHDFSDETDIGLVSSGNSFRGRTALCDGMNALFAVRHSMVLRCSQVRCSCGDVCVVVYVEYAVVSFEQVVLCRVCRVCCAVKER